MGTIRGKLMLVAIVVWIALVSFTPTGAKAGGVVWPKDPDTGEITPQWEKKILKVILPCNETAFPLVVRWAYIWEKKDGFREISGRAYDQHHHYIDGFFYKYGEDVVSGWDSWTLWLWCNDKSELCSDLGGCHSGVTHLVRGSVGSHHVKFKDTPVGQSVIHVQCQIGDFDPKVTETTYVYMPPVDGYPDGDVSIPLYLCSYLARDLDKVSSCSLSVIFPEHVTPFSVQPDSSVDSLFDSFGFLISGDTVSFFGDTGHSIPLDTLIFGIQIAEIQAYVDPSAPLLETEMIEFDSLRSGFYDSLGTPIDSINWIGGEIFIAPYDSIPPIIEPELTFLEDSLFVGDSGAVWDNNDTIPGWVGVGLQELYVDSLGDTLWLGVDWSPIDSLGGFSLIQTMYIDSSFVLRVVAEDYWGNADTLIYINPPLIRGDANGDGSVNLADAVFVVNWLFIGGPAPDPMEAGDANCDGQVNLADAVYIVNWLFIGGPPPGC
jgi:hypothetical protein